jgi:hypothetical protein
MSRSNVTWGAPRIRNELAKLGIDVAMSTVARFMERKRKPPSPSWRSFLDNHVKDLVAVDFFVVPTATFGVLFGVPGAGPRPPAGGALQGDRAPDSGVDGAAVGAGLPR